MIVVDAQTGLQEPIGGECVWMFPASVGDVHVGMVEHLPWSSVRHVEHLNIFDQQVSNYITFKGQQGLHTDKHLDQA